MKNIKEQIQNFKKMFKGIFERFTITMLVVFLTTLFCTIIYDTDWISVDLYANIMLFSIIIASTTFLIEVIIVDEKNKRILCYILSAILSLIFTYAVNIESNVLWMSNEIFLERIGRLIVCYIISVLVMAIYNLLKNSKQSFEEYFTHVSANIWKSTIIYSLLSSGIAIISAIFIFLILDGKDYSLILRLEILLFGIYYIPRILYSFYDVENEVGKFIKVIVKYVLNSLVIIAFVIIYLYIAKIFIVRDMPSNQIYRIIASLFVIGCPIWTVASYFNEDSLSDKITKKLPILFIPFILLQIYTIGVRIINNGFTEARYLCVMLIVFEIIYTIIYIKNKEKIGKILLAFIVLLLVSIIVPYVNMYKVATISQYNYLKIYKEKTTYTQEEKDKIKGAYNYLRYRKEGKELINKLLTQKDIDNINKLNNTLQIEKYNMEYIYASIDTKNINVEGYRKLNAISSYKYYNDSTNIYISTAFKDVKFNDNDISLDLSAIMRKYILNKDTISTYLKNNYEFVINEYQKVIITKISITYDELKQTISNYSINGYLLEK